MPFLTSTLRTILETSKLSHLSHGTPYIRAVIPRWASFTNFPLHRNSETVLCVSHWPGCRARGRRPSYPISNSELTISLPATADCLTTARLLNSRKCLTSRRPDTEPHGGPISHDRQKIACRLRGSSGDAMENVYSPIYIGKSLHSAAQPPAAAAVPFLLRKSRFLIGLDAA